MYWIAAEVSSSGSILSMTEIMAGLDELSDA